jgi:transposase
VEIWRNSALIYKDAPHAGNRLTFVAQFGNTLRHDLKAVELSIATPWSNGPIEGHINRLKAIKRQMYGRAGFELLKARVLPWDAPQAA